MAWPDYAGMNQNLVTGAVVWDFDIVDMEEEYMEIQMQGKIKCGDREFQWRKRQSVNSEQYRIMSERFSICGIVFVRDYEEMDMVKGITLSVASVAVSPVELLALNNKVTIWPIESNPDE